MGPEVLKTLQHTSKHTSKSILHSRCRNATGYNTAPKLRRKSVHRQKPNMFIVRSSRSATFVLRVPAYLHRHRHKYISMIHIHIPTIHAYTYIYNHIYILYINTHKYTHTVKCTRTYIYIHIHINGYISITQMCIIIDIYICITCIK